MGGEIEKDKEEEVGGRKKRSKGEREGHCSIIRCNSQ